MSQHCRANPCCGDRPCSGVPLPQDASGYPARNKPPENPSPAPNLGGPEEPISTEQLLARVASIICDETCGLTSLCKSREAAQALFDKGYLARSVAPVEIYQIIKDAVIDKENVSFWSRRIAAALSSQSAAQASEGGRDE